MSDDLHRPTDRGNIQGTVTNFIQRNGRKNAIRDLLKSFATERKLSGNLWLYGHWIYSKIKDYEVGIIKVY